MNYGIACAHTDARYLLVVFALALGLGYALGRLRRS